MTIRDDVVQLVPMFLRNMVFNMLHRFYLGWNYTAPDLGQGLYPRLAARNWTEAPALLRAFHGQSPDSHTCSGVVTVRRGAGLLTRLAAAAVGFPSAAMNSAVDVHITQQSDGCEVWKRVFSPTHSFVTTQYMENETMVERSPLLGNLLR